MGGTYRGTKRKIVLRCLSKWQGGTRFAGGIYVPRRVRVEGRKRSYRQNMTKVGLRGHVLVACSAVRYPSAMTIKAKMHAGPSAVVLARKSRTVSTLLEEVCYSVMGQEEVSLFPSRQSAKPIRWRYIEREGAVVVREPTHRHNNPHTIHDAARQPSFLVVSYIIPPSYTIIRKEDIE